VAKERLEIRKSNRKKNAAMLRNETRLYCKKQVIYDMAENAEYMMRNFPSEYSKMSVTLL
jgi:hypothetical protein